MAKQLSHTMRTLMKEESKIEINLKVSSRGKEKPQRCKCGTIEPATFVINIAITVGIHAILQVNDISHYTFFWRGF